MPEASVRKFSCLTFSLRGSRYFSHTCFFFMFCSWRSSVLQAFLLGTSYATLPSGPRLTIENERKEPVLQIKALSVLKRNSFKVIHSIWSTTKLTHYLVTKKKGSKTAWESNITCFKSTKKHTNLQHYIPTDHITGWKCPKVKYPYGNKAMNCSFHWIWMSHQRLSYWEHQFL